MTALAVLAVVVVTACVVGVVLRAQSGRVREQPAGGPSVANPALGRVGVGAGEPVILHFSAPWCGPCAAVRRVVSAVVEDPGDAATPVRDIELDLDENSSLAAELGVLSLPTTLLFDSNGRQRFRVSGVPTADDLRQALAAL
ncbi:thioredoxin family protein [Rhodococcus artemisiae]|uniref:Thioredoxin family protein n=1 Tax=Rhodococcus artemisiae TaxID=714159 RepID=A0ABU7LIC2_9NOCA|nr:thioredoxin family protein [Rhodococcus artemisiae]MEE2060642.1 thioredoxin family protein [Rhodococcus artemisiae]